MKKSSSSPSLSTLKSNKVKISNMKLSASTLDLTINQIATMSIHSSIATTLDCITRYQFDKPENEFPGNIIDNKNYIADIGTCLAMPDDTSIFGEQHVKCPKVEERAFEWLCRFRNHQKSAKKRIILEAT
jgi:hypothetical protein